MATETKIPRGIRNNNPGNIRHSRTLWQGEAVAQEDEDFIQFKHPVYGIRAIAKILLTYQEHGLATIHQMISRWAPPSENDTGAYAEACATGVGCTTAEKVDLRKPAAMEAMVKAIIEHENGQQPYTDFQIQQGMLLAGVHL